MDETGKEEPLISRNLGRLLGGIVAIAMVTAIATTSFYYAYSGRPQYP